MINIIHFYRKKDKNGYEGYYSNKNRKNLGLVAEGKLLPSLHEFFNILKTFTLVVFAWVFFRADNILHAISYISEIFSPSILSIPYFKDGKQAIPTIILLIIFIVIEWLGRKGKHALQEIGSTWNVSLRIAMYYAIIFLIFWYGGNEQAFIYFQF